MADTSASKRGALEMALCAVLWSIAGVFIKQIPWNAMVIAGFRSLIAAAVLALYIWRSGCRLVLTRRSVTIGAFLSFTSFCFMAANKLTTAANAIVLQYTAPVFLLLYGVVFRRQRFRAGDYIAVLCTMVGVTLFFFDQLSGGAVAGNLLAVVAGAGFAGMMAATGGVDENTRMSGLFEGHLLTALIGIPFVFVYGATATVPAIGSLLILGVFQLGVPYILYGLATETCAPLAVALLAALEPVLNPVWVFLFMGEAPGRTALWGGALVILSVTAWCVWDHRSRASEPAKA